MSKRRNRGQNGSQLPTPPSVTREPVTAVDTQESEPPEQPSEPSAEQPPEPSTPPAEPTPDFTRRAFPEPGCDACAQGGCWIHGYARRVVFQA
jgi:hypothetical protein